MGRLATTLLAIGLGAAVPLVIAARQTGEDDPAAFRIELADFQRLYAEGAVVVFDVRNPQAYLDGHVAGAVSLPLGSIDMKVKELRELERPIVTYCRCYQEATSLVAAQRLGRYGIEGARALVGGFDAWVAAGGAVETGDPAATEGSDEGAAPKESEAPPS